MNPRAASGERFANHQVLWLDGDELLCRVPATGIYCTMLKEMALHQAGAINSRRDTPQEKSIPPDFTDENFLPYTVHRRFEVYAQLNPGAGAVMFDRTKLTYGELDAQADGLAVLLQQNGLGPGDFCALCMTPSIAMVRALLAVLKAGGAYFMLNPMLPAEHIAAMLCTCHPKIVIVRENCSDRLPATNAQIIFCDEDEDDAGLPYAWPHECPTQRFSPAYAISKFSATGSPRFAVSAHMAVTDRLASIQEFSPIGQGDSVLQNTNSALDTFAWESLWPLSQGAQLVIPSTREETDPDCMRELISRVHITVMHVVPSLLQLLLTGACRDELRSLRALFCASDWPTDISSSAIFS